MGGGSWAAVGWLGECHSRSLRKDLITNYPLVTTVHAVGQHITHRNTATWGDHREATGPGTCSSGRNQVSFTSHQRWYLETEGGLPPKGGEVMAKENPDTVHRNGRTCGLSWKAAALT